MTIKNRSDILLLFDAKDCNPNGDPLTADNVPRIDSYTQQGLVTGGRIKRYIRDQMFDDGETILVRKPGQYEGDDVMTIDELYDEIVEEAKEDGIDLEDEDDETVRRQFLNYVTDVRFFGNVLADARPDAVKGPVQFSIGRTLHRVSRNQDASKITAAVSTGDGSGGAIGSDERIHYGLFAVDADVNENVADNTDFGDEDVKYLDNVVWRAMSNQTHSHTKSGQMPAMYVRVEYITDDFQIGRLSDSVDINNYVDEEKIRNPSDYTIDLSGLSESLELHDHHIESVYYHADENVFDVSTEDGEVSVEEALSGDYEVHEIPVWE